jgi:hypothetical protein
LSGPDLAKLAERGEEDAIACIDFDYGTWVIEAITDAGNGARHGEPGLAGVLKRDAAAGEYDSWRQIGFLTVLALALFLTG